MSELLDLYRHAEASCVGVYWFNLEEAQSLSYRDVSGACHIAMDPWKLPTLADEKVKLAHELGHCETGSFYNCSATLDLRQKHENHANRWAIERLVPAEQLLEKVRDGFLEPWSLAEEFGVTEDFMRLAMEHWRTQGRV